MCGTNGGAVNGRYVTITVVGDNKILTLCEVAIVARQIEQVCSMNL